MMRTSLTWCAVLVAVATISGCESGAPEPRNGAAPDGLKILTTTDLVRLFGQQFGDRNPQVEFDEFIAMAQAHDLALPHPLCFQDSPEDGIPEGCGRLTDGARPEISTRDGIPFLLVDNPADPDFDYPTGYSGYELVGVYGPLLFVKTIWNGGGTGQFSSARVVWSDQSHAVDANTLGVTLAAGDRCNGGVVRFELDEALTAHMEISLTPFDLLNFNPLKNQPPRLRIDLDSRELLTEPSETPGEEGTEAQSTEPVGGWDAYSDISACAVCCAGLVRHGIPIPGDAPRESLILFTPEIFAQASEAGNGLQGDKAMAQVLANHPQANQWLTPAQWNALVEQIVQYSAGNITPAHAEGR